MIFGTYASELTHTFHHELMPTSFKYLFQKTADVHRHNTRYATNPGPDYGGQRGQLPRVPRCKGSPRHEIYMFKIKYSFEKFS